MQVLRKERHGTDVSGNVLTYKRDGNKAHIKSGGQYEVYPEHYYVKQSDNTYVYNKAGGGSSEWIKEEYDNDYARTYMPAFKLFDDSVRQAGEDSDDNASEYASVFTASCFGSFGYDAKESAYIANFSRVQTESDIGALEITTKVTVKIVDGKFAYGKFVDKISKTGAELQGEFRVYDKGNTSVTLPNGDQAETHDVPETPDNPDKPDVPENPDVPEVVGKQVDAEQWESAVSFDGLDNYTSVLSSAGGTVTVKSDGNVSFAEMSSGQYVRTTYYLRGKDENKMYASDGNGGFFVENFDAASIKYLIDTPENVEYILSCVLSGKYSDFSYDADKEEYSAENISVEMQGTEGDSVSNAMYDATVKFSDGKLVFCRLYGKTMDGQEVPSEQALIEYNIFDYGKTVIELPDFGGDNDDPSGNMSFFGEWSGSGGNMIVSNNGEAVLYIDGEEAHFEFPAVRETETGYMFAQTLTDREGQTIGKIEGIYNKETGELALSVYLDDGNLKEESLFKK